MMRDDAIARLRRHLPALRSEGITGMVLVGATARDGANGVDPIEVLLDIDLDAHPDFDLLALAGIEIDLEQELGVPVRAFVGPGMRADALEAIARHAVPIA